MNNVPMVEIPKYVCHKEVRAAKITKLLTGIGGSEVTLMLGEIGGCVSMDLDWVEKHKPKVGGYYVVYADGYTSYSPATPFESGYTKKI